MSGGRVNLVLCAAALWLVGAAAIGSVRADDDPPKVEREGDGAERADDAEATDPVGEVTTYRLPWSAGASYRCIQGANGWISHQGKQQWDFIMPVGTTITAARAGVVARVVQHHTERGNTKPNNKVGVDHGDGTVAWYLHIDTDGALVRVGQRVARGEPVARSGNIGRSAMPHLHFHVTDAATRKTVAIRFEEIGGDGVPHPPFSYRSKNAVPPPAVPPPAEEPPAEVPPAEEPPAEAPAPR